MIDYFTIYRSPTDYPGRYVVRRFISEPGTLEPQPREVIAVVDTLDAARAALPEGLVCFERHPLDQLQIVETWL